MPPPAAPASGLEGAVLPENVQFVTVRLPSPVALKPPPSPVSPLLLLLKVTLVSVRLSPEFPRPSMAPPPREQSPSVPPVVKLQAPPVAVRLEIETAIAGRSEVLFEDSVDAVHLLDNGCALSRPDNGNVGRESVPQRQLVPQKPGSPVLRRYLKNVRE